MTQQATYPVTQQDIKNNLEAERLPEPSKQVISSETGLAIIDPKKFGQLIDLPTILQANRLSAANAKKATDDLLKDFPALNGDAAMIEAKITQVNNLRLKLEKTAELINGKRKPSTAFMDEIKGLFTAEEKIVSQCTERVKNIANDWEREKARRNRVQQEENNKKITAEQDKIAIATKIRQNVNVNYSKLLNDKIQKANDIFNATPLVNFDGLESGLKKANPAMPEDTWQLCIKNVLPPATSAVDANAIQSMAATIFVEIKNAYTEDWHKKVDTERHRLIDIIPSRKRELSDADLLAAANARIARENSERANLLQADVQHKNEQLDSQAQADSLNKTFEVSATATPISVAAKGTSKKRKYVCTKHAALLAVLQSWVKNNFPYMTVEDLNTKLSFTRTAANIRLNDGSETIEADGLEIIEDFSTRAVKPAGAK